MTASSSLSRARFFGVWSLERWELWRDGELFAYPHGENATGRLIYTTHGEMSAFLQHEDWAGFDGQGAAAADAFIAYGGRWRVAGEEVSHTVAFANTPGWVGRDLVRRARFERRRLILETPPVKNRRGFTLTNYLTWTKSS